MGDYVDQPGVGGSSLQFPVMGTRYTVTVARPLGDGDFPVQTEMDNITPKRFSDGRVMVRMSVPVLVQPDAAQPDGHATLSVQGQLAEALKQAMSAVGAGEFKGVPEAGAVITVAWTSERPAKRAGYNNQKIYEVIYQRPPGAAQAAPGPIAQIPAQVAQQYAGYQAAAQQDPNGQYALQPAPQYQAPAPPPVPQYPVSAVQLTGPGQPVSQPAPGMAPPGQQVAYAAQQGLQAAQAPVMDPATQEKLQQLLGSQAPPQ